MQKALLPFYSTKKSGSGLGLALCREILEAHGGKLDLVSRPRGPDPRLWRESMSLDLHRKTRARDRAWFWDSL